LGRSYRPVGPSDLSISRSWSNLDFSRFFVFFCTSLRVYQPFLFLISRCWSTLDFSRFSVFFCTSLRVYQPSCFSWGKNLTKKRGEKIMVGSEWRRPTRSIFHLPLRFVLCFVFRGSMFVLFLFLCFFVLWLLLCRYVFKPIARVTLCQVSSAYPQGFTAHHSCAEAFLIFKFSWGHAVW